jgi:chromosomal replication initiator protein
MPGENIAEENAKELWKKVLGELEVEMSPMAFKTWISRAKAVTITETSLELACPDELVKNMFLTKYLPMIQSSVDRLGKGHFQISLKVSREEKKERKSDDPPLFKEEPREEKPAPPVTEKDIIKSGLSPKFTFENYLMGSNNQVAFAIAQAIAREPGTVYNPFFLYAGVGLGKTHLIQAIGNDLLKKRPGIKVVYCTGESFTNELIENLQMGKKSGKYSSNSFRDKYRKVDVLIIDDIQFIAGKPSTQEEFFHTFDALYRAQKQIIISSDRPPREFTNIEDRITSRFGSGIIADIQAPDLEMRTAILRKRRDTNKDEVPNGVIDFIAETIATNVRELEGAYLQVLTYSKALGIELNVQTAAKALGQAIQESSRKPVNINQILKAVSNYYSVKTSDIKGSRRTKELVIPRQVAMYLIKELTGTSYVTIGELLGGRDHTTIMHGVSKVEQEIVQIAKTRQDVANVKQIISSIS